MVSIVSGLKHNNKKEGMVLITQMIMLITKILLGGHGTDNTNDNAYNENTFRRAWYSFMVGFSSSLLLCSLWPSLVSNTVRLTG